MSTNEEFDELLAMLEKWKTDKPRTAMTLYSLRKATRWLEAKKDEYENPTKITVLRLALTERNRMIKNLRATTVL